MNARGLIALLVLPCLIVASGFLMMDNHYEARIVRSYDEGALFIIEQVVQGKNVQYVTLSGVEYYIELVADEANWLPKESMCGECHAKDTQTNLTKGGI